ncbi:inorganic phosphate transporter [Marininema halotolerans]|uniref:Sulfate permease n=1 Tax=Marininema halotolerans TaxID=1155944 RepID=A0A1I6S2C5_9BACL|nr:inorganic phosphate transporter [Marininema halotolerans]SFS71113.1 sulfate permease [Marininema halotolerans]
MTIIYIGYIVAFFFAMNIGASGAAASMGVAYGAGAIKRPVIALLISGVGVFLGAAIGGGEVVKTIGSGIVPGSIMTIKLALIVLTSACLSLFIANLLGIPLSTSEVTVGAVVGAGVAYKAVAWSKMGMILSFWVLIPGIAFLLAWLAGKGILAAKGRFPLLISPRIRRPLAWLLVFTGFLEAFSAGMNNVANAVGPLVGAKILSTSAGILYGGIFVALGAILLGRRVLETNGKRITNISLLEGSAVSGTGAGLVIGASLLGIPVPLTQITSSAIIGIGTAKQGFSKQQKNVIAQMVKVWLVSPVFSLVIAYALVKIFIQGELYTILVLLSVFLATAGSISLMRSVREDRRSYHEHGGGI